MKKKLLFLPFTFLLFTCLSFAQTLAPGGPGKDAQWASAGKQGVGTSATLESKVWFTLQGGALTEVYYPNVAVGNVHLLQFVVVNPKTKKVETERDDATHEIKVLRPDSLTFQQINTAKSGEWKITKTYVTNPKGNSIWISVKFEPTSKDLELYVHYDPSLKNSGMHDTASAYLNKKSINFLNSNGKDTKKIVKVEPLFVSSDGDITSVLFFDTKTEEETSGFLGTSDGFAQLREKGSLKKLYDVAKDGNVVQMARIINPQNFVATLAFGKNTLDALNQTFETNEPTGFDAIRAEYEKGWSDYVKTLRKVDPKYQAQFNMAAMILKAHEDKTYRGANIASMSVPWGGGDNANEDNVGGYHLVWSRDLYQVFTAYMALGDKAAAERALDFLLKVQQKPDGSFPQNSWLDGKPFWGSLQMDEVAYPLIMAYQLKRFDKETYTKHLKPAADFIVKNGPATPQERWEEEGGYSPSTIAAEIAGLVCVAEIAKQNGDLESAKKYLATADEWEANIEKWTATTTGKYGDGNYYLRITQNGKPDAGEKIELNNGAGTFDEREIVDAGFLELVRLGIKSPDDPLIAKSVKVIDEVIKVDTPNGEAFYRYNHDGYGEMDDGRRWNWDGKYTGKGRLWVLLSGERGQYELALANLFQKATEKPQSLATGIDGLTATSMSFRRNSFERLNSMQKFANNGLMIPEQVWDKKEVPEADSQFSPNLQFGEGTGSATPLAWSMAQFIRLAVNLQEGKNLDTPDVVYERYVLGKKDNLNSKSSEKLYKTDSLPISCEQSFVFIEQLNMTYSPRVSSEEWKPWTVPLITDDKKATFFYKGKGDVEVIGDFTKWKSQGLKLKEVTETEWKCFNLKLPINARIEYKLIVDGKWITDPLNPNKIDNGVGGENSVLEMPEYKPTEWANSEGMTKNPIYTKKINSKIYGERKIEVYVPEGYNEKSLPVMYLQDGTDYMNRAAAITIQRNLVKAGKIKPFIMVFVDYEDRMKEYMASDDYAKYLATEIVPVIDRDYKTIKSRDGRMILGASLGGITSIWTALKYPQVFANVGGQSSSFWVDDERVVKELEKLKGDKKFNFYLDDGTFEGVEDSRKVVKILSGKGFQVKYVEAETGHNWTSWRDRLADAFVALMK